jgi:hypothetical protein
VEKRKQHLYVCTSEMDSASEAKSVRMPTFDDEYKTFQIWWTRFTAFVTVYKFVESITIDMPTTWSEELDLMTPQRQ